MGTRKSVPLRMRETVLCDTPAIWEISFIVGRPGMAPV
jgi:hypothetical protein